MKTSLLNFMAGLSKPVMAGVLCLMALAGCSGSKDEPVSDLPLQVQITDAGFLADGSRVYSHDFELGDKAGVFVVKDGKVVVDNAEAMYDGSAWNVNAVVRTSKADETCFVYFPYRADAASLVNLTASTAADFFRPMQNTISNVLDQSIYSNVKPSDIMYASAAPQAAAGTYTVSAALDHMLALATWDLSDGVAYTTSDGFGYKTPSSYTDISVKLGDEVVKPCTVSYLKGFYYIPGSVKGRLTVSYNDAGKICSFDVALDAEAGNATKVIGGKGSTDGGVRDFAAGDIYYSDGSVLPVEEAAKLADGAAPAGAAGLIFQTDKSRFSDAEKEMGEVHALVISAKKPTYNGNASVKWFDDYPSGKDDGNRNENVEDPAYPGLYLPFICSDESLAASFNINNSDINGYNNTHVIWTRRADDMEKGWYQVFSAVKDFNVSVPAGTSGWYLPSIGQLMDLYRTIGKVAIEADHLLEFMGVSDCTADPNYAGNLQMYDNMDASLMKIREDERDLFSSSDAIWSSSFSKTISTYTQDVAYCARQIVTVDKAVSVISLSTFGNNTESRAVLSF